MRLAPAFPFFAARFSVFAPARLRPWSVALPRRGGTHVLEAQAGAFERWGLVPGDEIELREPS